MAGILGNVGPGRITRNTGSGIAHRRLPYSHTTVSAKAGESVRISATDLFDKVINGEVQIQAFNGPVAVYITAADVDLALNPEQDSGGHWVLDHTTSGNGVMTKLGKYVSAIRLDFTGDGIVYILGV